MTRLKVLLIGECANAHSHIAQCLALANSALGRISRNLVCSYPVDDSCLWIRVLDKGNVSRDAPALRPSDFGRLLREVFNGEHC